MTFEQSSLTTVKLIGTKFYEVELLVSPNDTYFIRYQNKRDLSSSESEYIHDFKTASILFDLKVIELEGN